MREDEGRELMIISEYTISVFIKIVRSEKVTLYKINSDNKNETNRT